MRYSKLLPNQMENLIEIVKDHIDILLIEDDESRGVCPFCNGGRSHEKTFCIEIETGLSICHRASCGWKGNAISLLSELLDLSYERAKETLNGKEDYSIESIIQLVEYDSEIPFKRLANRAWINDAYKPSRWPSDVLDWIRRRGYSPDEFFQYNDVWMPPDGLYNGRVIFKVESNNVLAYQLYDFTGKNPRKTINPEGEFLSRTLYNYNQGNPIHECSAEFLLVHEGIFDVARSLTRDYNACCIFGTNLSSYQEELLRQHKAKEIVVCLDGDTNIKDLSKDKAWQIATRLSKTISKQVSIMRLPLKDDPDSCDESVFDACFDSRLVLKDKDEWLFENL